MTWGAPRNRIAGAISAATLMEARAPKSEADGLAGMNIPSVASGVAGAGAVGSSGDLVGDDVLGDQPAARATCKYLLSALGIDLGLTDVLGTARIEELAGRGKQCLSLVALAVIGLRKLPPTEPVVVLSLP